MVRFKFTSLGKRPLKEHLTQHLEVRPGLLWQVDVPSQRRPGRAPMSRTTHVGCVLSG